MKLSFTKMQGCANDYIYLDCRASGVPADIAALAQRQHMVAGAQLGVEQILGQQQRVNGVQIQQWRAEDQRDLVG